jgi:hydrogenase/urease accessory protein HupE
MHRLLALLSLLPLLPLIALITLSRTARAHEFRPCVLDIRDLGGGRFDIAWRSPDAAPTLGGADEPAPVFPAHCRITPLATATSRSILDCNTAGLAGHTITVRGLGGARPDALVRLLGADGSTLATSVLRADSPSLKIPATFGASPFPSAYSAVAASYFGAGVEHILRGPDHLLFVLALLLLNPRRGRLIATITAFTLAHSITLGLAALRAVRLPPAPVEAAIALSLVLIAAELARSRDASPPLAQPRLRSNTVAVAFIFGLLHGFGFAGGLAELGVPDGQIPLALVAFNLGVEAGQLAFVAIAMIILAAARRVSCNPPGWLAKTPAYVIGALAASWCIERVARFWS